MAMTGTTPSKKNKSMITIGITGGVGSGKSLLVDYLSRMVPSRVIYADTAAKDLYRPGGPCYEELLDILGRDNGICLPDGSIDRVEMAARIFADDALLEKVEGLLHPAVFDYIKAEIERERLAGSAEIFIVEAALLVECGYRDILDSLWYVYCDEDIRRIRLRSSRGYSDERIDGILRNQLSDEAFRSACDVVIDNSNDMEASYRAVRQAYRKLGCGLKR